MGQADGDGIRNGGHLHFISYVRLLQHLSGLLPQPRMLLKRLQYRMSPIRRLGLFGGHPGARNDVLVRLPLMSYDFLARLTCKMNVAPTPRAPPA